MKNKIFGKISSFFKKTATYQESENKMSDANNTPAREEYERCIVCGRITRVPVSMPIKLRKNYAIGLGQLCTECAKKNK